MTGLRTRRRSLAIAGALCLAAAALVAVSMPAAADAGPIRLHRNYFQSEPPVMI
ncbi:hypothetical protein ACFXHA_33920 [Nocardia sp. NPDC059240]|uniref:hypothetical protein n=1 Tax=Nocardia sp. NPDC059240 TaxID=3346786 RepID=UPI00369FF8F7